MLSRRSALAAVIAGAAMMAIPAHAIEKKPFDPQVFAAAQAAGKSILVEVSAPWCPVCKAQAPILANLAGKPAFKNLAIFEVDFDTRKDVLKSLGVQKQSTLIVFKGRQEMGRSTGDTNAVSIESLLTKASVAPIWARSGSPSLPASFQRSRPACCRCYRLCSARR